MIVIRQTHRGTRKRDVPDGSVAVALSAAQQGQRETRQTRVRLSENQPAMARRLAGWFVRLGRTTLQTIYICLEKHYLACCLAIYKHIIEMCFFKCE